MNSVMSRRSGSAALAALLLLVSCSSGSDTPTPEGALPTANEHPGQVEDPGAEKSDGKKKDRDGGRSKDGGSSGEGRDSGGQQSGGSSGNKDQGGSGTVADGTGSPYPAAGTYTYKQSGFEEFCQTTSCERDELPPQQPVKVTYKSHSDTEAVVVSEVRASDSRVARTTFKFTQAKALITDVFTRFEYEGFEFSDSYHPDPPVEAMRFPLRSGMKWSGTWKDETSGDYSISVGDMETVSVNGQSVRAFRIETETNFRGQFDGKSIATVWFDPETKTVVKSDGMLDVKSEFGRYNTEFSTLLDSGPGY